MKNEKGWTRLAVKYKLFSEHDTEHEPKTNDNRKRYPPPWEKKLKEKNTIVCLQVLKAQMVKNGYGKKRNGIKPNYF